MRPEEYKKWMDNTVRYLKRKKKILFLTTSNRWSGETGGERPKSTALAFKIAEKIGSPDVEIIEVPKLKIHPCEGNISTARGNTCGPKKALLKDPAKNPSGCHRCWASFNNPDDELWKVSKALFQSDAVVFFGSIRWGQVNSHYQKLIERLSWIENRHSTLGEDNLLQNIDAGIITVGHNWHGRKANEIQQQTLRYYGFKVPDALSWHWQFTEDAEDESDESYKAATQAFRDTFLEP
jgi:multimeric flavodoxin WrbA